MLAHPTLAAAVVHDGRIRETNAPWNALFAVPAGVSVESHVATLFPNVAAADRFARGLQSDLAAPAAAARGEHLLMRRDGTAFVAEIVTRRLGDGDVVWQVRDLTVERTLRQELRDLEDYHRELSRRQDDVTFVIDRKGRISYVSASIEDALGHRGQRLLGKPFASLLDPAHAASAEQWLRAASGRGGEGPGNEASLKVRHRDGSVRDLACRASDCFGVPRIAGLLIHARAIDADRSPVPERRLDALVELVRAPSPVDGRVDAALNTIREGVDASSATFRPVAADGSSPVHAGNVAGPSVAKPEGGPLEVPVVNHGRHLGWLAVVASPPRAWSDADVDFVVAGAFVVALALETGSERERLSGRDPLTGLPMRAEALADLVEKLHERAPDATPAVIAVDLDRLCDLNEAEGLEAGDAAIRRAAEVLIDVAGPENFVARVDGDEFLLVVRDAKSRDLDAMVESIVGRLAAAEDGVPTIDASIGVARCTDDVANDGQTLLHQAARALGEAKERGGAKAVVFDRALADRVRFRTELAAGIEVALADDQFTIFYQPQVALDSGLVVGLEALLRWRHPTRGVLLPEVFMAEAFRRGLIDAVTKFVLAKVCAQAAAWRRAGTLGELPVAVNVSGRRFHDRRLPALVASALLRNGLPARALVLEITEQNLVGDEAQVDRVVKELARLGVRIAIGNFNAGHAASRFLRQVRVSQVKLDGGFVRDLPDDAESVICVAAFIDLARRLNYQVVAEGIETRAQFEHLRALGCGVGQGFHLGAPMPVPELEAWVASNRRDPIR